MSQIEDLIARYCPEGVEFKTLGEMGTLYGGLTGKSKADFTPDGNARFLSYVAVFNNLIAQVGADRVTMGPGERQEWIRRGDVLFTASSENSHDVGMSSAVTDEPSEPVYLNSFCFGFRPHDLRALDPEFSKYLFRSDGVRRQIIRAEL